MKGTIFDLLNDDPTALMQLIREVYTKGLSDGAEAARRQDNLDDIYDSIYDVFHSWDLVESMAEKPVYTVEEFVDSIFESDNY